MRGFNRPGDYGTRLLLLTDGARRNDPLFDQALLGNESPIEIDWVKRIEFVAGPASSVLRLQCAVRNSHHRDARWRRPLTARG